jgi:tRNA dimethylallyltransferase
VDPLIVIVGETASGKTALAIELAQQFNGEIICADSRTIYRGMDIGTAKPSTEEQAIVPHHLLDIRNPDERYSAAQFQQDANRLIKEITNRGKLPIMVGGTGLYIDAVIYGYQFPEVTERSAENPRHSTNPTHDQQLRENTLVLGLQIDREELAARLQQRAESMLGAGLIAEVQALTVQYGDDNETLRGSGYSFFADHLAGEISLEEATEKFVHNHLLLAKRQRTWFKRNKSIQWLDNRGNAVAITTTFLNNLPV